MKNDNVYFDEHKKQVVLNSTMEVRKVEKPISINIEDIGKFIEEKSELFSEQCEQIDKISKIYIEQKQGAEHEEV